MGAVVVTGDGVEVGQAVPVLVAGAHIEAQQARFAVVAQAAGGGEPCAAQGGDRVAGLEAMLIAGQLALTAHRYRLAFLPAVGLEVVGDAADGIYRIPQVGMAVAIEVHRIALEAGGHKLAIAHGARIGALGFGGVHPLVAGHHQEGFQLAREELGTARVIKRQGGQRIQNAGLAHHPAPAGLDPDNADDDLRRHPVDLLRPVQLACVFTPEVDAVLYVVWGDELGAITVPGTGRASGLRGGRRLGIHQADDPVVTLCLCQHLMQLGVVKTVLLDHLLDEPVHVGAIGKVPLANPLCINGFARWRLIDKGALGLGDDHGLWRGGAAAATEQGE